jgi:hypothetical protein
VKKSGTRGDYLMENTYTVYWLDGKKEIVKGTSISDSFRKAGLGGGALRAVDFYAENSDNDYVWNKQKHNWEKNYEKNIS